MNNFLLLLAVALFLPVFIIITDVVIPAIFLRISKLLEKKSEEREYVWLHTQTGDLYVQEMPLSEVRNVDLWMYEDLGPL